MLVSGYKRGLAVLLTSTCLGSAVPAAHAQDTTLDTVVVEGEGGEGEGTGPFTGYVPRSDASATKGDAPLIETPQAVSVVGAEQIRDQAARTVVEATRYSPGIRSETFGNDTRNDWFLIRGFTSQVNSYFLDGLQLQSSNTFATWKVNPYLLERIDILRGPSSALYGSSNPGGLVNLVSKRPTFRDGGEVSVGINEYGNVWSGIDAEGVTKDGTMAYRVVATGNAGDTEVDFTKDDQFSFMPTITYAPDADTKITAYAHVSKLKTNGQNFLPYEGTVVDAPFGRISRDFFSSEPSVDEFERTQLMAGYEAEHKFTDDVTVRQNLRFARLGVDFTNVYGLGYASPPTVDTGSLARGNFYTAPDVDLFNIDNQVEWSVETGPLQHTLLFGLDYKRFDLRDEAGFEIAPPIDVLNPVYLGVPRVTGRYDQSSTVQNQTGLYVQDRIEIDRLNVVLSGRYDDVETKVTNRPTGERTDYSSDAFSGRAGLIYNFDNGIAPYVSASRSFLPLVGTDSQTGSPLDPEEGTQYEAGVKYQPAEWGDSLLSASVFDLTRSNFATSDGVPFSTRQIGKINSQGFELEAVGQITDALKATAAYTWYDIEIEDGDPAEFGKSPVAIPDQFGSLWLDYSLLSGPLQGVSLGGGVRYVGSSYADAANELKVDDVVLFDAAIRYEKDNFAAALNASNLFDEDYVSSCNSTSACFYGASREVNLTLTYKW